MGDVKLVQVSKTYPNGVTAVKESSFTANDGEFVVLVGPSGCGKSTLLRMVAGLESITTGELLIGGNVVNDVDPAHRDIAMVFQNYALYPHMTVAKNMGYGLKNRGVATSEINKKVEEAARMLDLSEYLGRKPSQLSGGQRQRVAMGRAIVRSPGLFLFDEPLSNLDAKLRNQMRIEIRSLQRRLGVTSLYVTHDQVEAMTLADKIIVLNDGYIEQVGTPSEIYNQPASTFVASFMGAPPMNIIDVNINSGSISVGPQCRLSGLPGPAEQGQFRLGIRPEDVSPTSDSPIRMNVHIIEELGANRLLHGEFGGQAFSISVQKHIDVDTGIIPIAIADHALHWFDTDAGRRLNA